MLHRLLVRAWDSRPGITWHDAEQIVPAVLAELKHPTSSMVEASARSLMGEQIWASLTEKSRADTINSARAAFVAAIEGIR